MQNKLKILGKIILWVAISVIAITGLLVFLAFHYQDEIKQRIIGELNKHLNAKVSVKEVDFSLLEKFPSATLSFKEIKIQNSLDKSGKSNLVSAGRLFLSFNIINIFNKNYKIKQIELENGSAFIYTNKFGNDNYHIWKSVDTTVTSPVEFSLQKVILKNIQLEYLNKPTNTDLQVNLKKAVLKGNFSDVLYELKIDASTFVKRLKVDNTSYIKQKEVELNLGLDVNNNKIYTFKNAEVVLSALLVSVTGKIDITNNPSDIDLNIKGKDLDIPSLISVMPGNFTNDIRQYKSKGDITLNATITGRAGNGNVPLVDVDFSISEGSLKYQEKNVNLTGIFLKGSYTNGKSRSAKTSVLRLQNFNTSIENGKIGGDCVIEDFNNPVARGNLKGAFNLKDIVGLMKLDTLQNIEGVVEGDIAFVWPLKFESTQVNDLVRSYKTTGTLIVSNASFGLKHKDFKVEELNSNLTFDNNDVKINTLSLKANKSDITLKGYFDNLIPFILSPNEKLTIEADVNSRLLVMDELLSYNYSNSNSTDTSYRLVFPKNIDFSFSSTIGRLQFRHFVADKLTGEFDLHNRKLAAKNIVFNTMDGQVKMSALTDGTDTNNIRLICDAEMKGINTKKMFFQMENFGQENITHRNIKGNLTATFAVQGEWDSKLNIDEKKLMATANIAIDKGELIDYEPMMALSKYIEVSELKRISFSTLKNQIQIANRIVTIPSMEINSSVLSITASGTHTFDQYLDYHFKIYMRDLLAKKARAKKENNEFGEEEDDGQGMYLYMTMVGPVDNLKFTYDKKGLKTKIKDDIQTEKNTIKSLLKEEFGLFKKDTTLKPVNNKKREGTIQMEWEEDKKIEKSREDKREKGSKDEKSKDGKKGKLNNLLKENKDEYESSDKYQ